MPRPARSQAGLTAGPPSGCSSAGSTFATKRTDLSNGQFSHSRPQRSYTKVTKANFIYSLFGPFAPVLNSVEARLLAQALGCLRPEAQQLTFQLAFEDILPGGNADGQQYAALEAAQTRLAQPLKYETLRQGHRCSEYIVLFPSLSLDENPGQITGEFNPYLRAYWLELAGAFTAIEVELLLQLR